MRRPRTWRALSALLTIGAVYTALVGIAHGVDQGITGKKLLLKTSKFVLLSKDPSIGTGGSDAVGGADSSITFDDGGPLPSTTVVHQSPWGYRKGCGLGTLPDRYSRTRIHRRRKGHQS